HLQVSIALAQHAVVETSNDKIGSPALAPLDWFVEVRFPIPNINPSTVRLRSTLLQGRRPALRFPRPAHQLAPSFPTLALGMTPSTPALLAQQAQRHRPRSLFQIPAFD